MIRKLALAVSLAVGSLPMSVYALGMGDMTTHSALNEKFKADIQLISVKKGSLDTLKVSLAPADVFSRVGLERSFFLTRLKFEPMRLKNGKAIIRVTSQDPIREPFLDFFVKIDWPNGQLVREYTALLDPPAVTKRRASNVRAATTQAAAATKAPRVTRTSTAAATPSARVQRAQTEGEYGPVQANETLWEIADSIRTEGISIHQMMMALYKANPDAFLHNNINLLKKGRVLKVPSTEEITGIGRKEAVSEFQQQTEAWMSNTGQAPAAAEEGQVAETAGEAEAQTPAETAGSEDVQLKIAGAPTTEPAAGDTEQPVSDLEVEEGSADLKQKMLLLEEEAETARQESAQVRTQLETLQQQLEDTQRLLKLKDEELARLQQGMGEVAATETLTEETGAEAPAEETTAAGETPEPETAVGETETETEAVTAEPEQGTEETAAVAVEETAGEAAAEGEQLTGTEQAPAEGSEEAAPVEEEVVAAVEEETPVAEAPQEQQPAPEAATEAEKAPEEKAPEEAAKPVSFMDKAMAWVQENWQLAVGAGGAFLLLLLALLLGRRKKSGGSATPMSQMSDESVDQESILLEEESSLADTVADHMAAGAVGDTSFLSEYSTEEFRGLQEDTAEVDPVSEADVYIAYGRYQQAEEILRDAMAAGNDSAAVKYKMLEVYYATQKKDAFASLAEEMVKSGQYEEDPKVWEHIQIMGRDLDKANPLFIAGVAASASALVDGGDGAGEDSELSLDLSMLAEEVDSVLNVDSEPLEGFSELDLDISGLAAEDTAEVKAEAEKSDDSISTDQLAASDNEALAETELHTEMLDINDLGDLDVGSTNLDDALADLSGDLEGVMADSQILDEPLDLEDDRFSNLDEGITPDSQISGLEDDLNVSVGEDSVIGDEVETKLELAKAFMEIGDADGARRILQEVEEDGTPEQKEIAAQLLGQIED
ncbi:FimV/HubP family polar landmark protein [Thiolapillus sp.]|uniref:FimV/HubP family polar landmark protein n=1 Tax=Thiolapillus sp. TaxID=2017437 RepID=UPI003AF98BC2